MKKKEKKVNDDNIITHNIYYIFDCSKLVIYIWVITNKVLNIQTLSKTPFRNKDINQ